MANKALGKGLEELFSNAAFSFNNFEDNIVKEEKNSSIEIPLDEIRSNPYQPRKTFSDESLNELAESIKEYGVVEPIIVKKSVKGYEIVAGERRTKASRIAGLTTIPAIVKDFSDDEMMEIALLENIQREDLNPIDEAEGIYNIISKKGMTQEEFARKFGKSRSYITNLIGLLRLPDETKKFVKDGKISMSHARSLSKLEDENKITELSKKIVSDGLSVRDVENMLSEKTNKLRLEPPVAKNKDFGIYEEIISEAIGNKVKVSNKKIEIYYDSIGDLNRIMEILHLEVKD